MFAGESLTADQLRRNQNSALVEQKIDLLRQQIKRMSADEKGKYLVANQITFGNCEEMAMTAAQYCRIRRPPSDRSRPLRTTLNTCCRPATLKYASAHAMRRALRMSAALPPWVIVLERGLNSMVNFDELRYPEFAELPVLPSAAQWKAASVGHAHTPEWHALSHWLNSYANGTAMFTANLKVYDNYIDKMYKLSPDDDKFAEVVELRNMLTIDRHKVIETRLLEVGTSFNAWKQSLAEGSAAADNLEQSINAATISLKSINERFSKRAIAPEQFHESYKSEFQRSGSTTPTATPIQPLPDLPQKTASARQSGSRLETILRDPPQPGRTHPRNSGSDHATSPPRHPRLCDPRRPVVIVLVGVDAELR
jgi:hypothetical protein